MKLSAMVAIALVVTACGAQQLPPADRVLCYATADVAAQRRVDLECVGTGDVRIPFSVCPARESILAQLKAEQEACK